MTRKEYNKKRAEAFYVAIMATLIRDAQMIGDGKTTLGQVKPISMEERIKAAKDAVDLIFPKDG